MSSPDTPAPDPGGTPDSLQFNRAEPAGPVAPTDLKCSFCGKLPENEYYLVNGMYACSECAAAARSAPLGQPRPAELMRAFVYGLGAAFLGTAIYFGVLAISGYEIGWIAVIVGWLVGKAVAKGGNHQGGWKLQAIAMALTYFSIVGSYMPLIVKSAMEQTEEAKKGGAAPVKPEQPGVPKTEVETPKPAPSFGEIAASFGMLFILSLALPFLQGLQSIIGLFIIAIGLFEAWKLNKRPMISVEGPIPAIQQS